MSVVTDVLSPIEENRCDGQACYSCYSESSAPPLHCVRTRMSVIIDVSPERVDVTIERSYSEAIRLSHIHLALCLVLYEHE